jgi:hypothetical protein
VLVELSVVEQRYHAVMEVAAPESDEVKTLTGNDIERHLVTNPAGAYRSFP